MKKFEYKAWDENFNIVKGVINKEDLESTAEDIKSRGLKIVYIKEKKSIKEIGIFNKDLSDEALANFCGQTAIIIDSGISLLNGLEIIEKQTKNKHMKQLIRAINDGVKSGNSLAQAMIDSGSFPKLLTDMILTGEISGSLDTVLYNMESFYKREANIKNKIKSASIYPALILMVAVGMVFFFNFLIYPELKGLFEDMDLPTITIIVIGTLNYLNANFLGIIFTFIVILILGKYIQGIPKVRHFIDKIYLNIPILGEFQINIITARFTRSMGIFLKSGVPIMTIMDNIKFILGNEFIKAKIENLRSKVISGTKLAEAIEKEYIFDPLVVQMIKVGEETGALDDMMSKLAEIYDGKVETGVTKLMSLIEPVLTLIVGGFVAVVIIAMALPLMQMTQGNI